MGEVYDYYNLLKFMLSRAFSRPHDLLIYGWPDAETVESRENIFRSARSARRLLE